MILRLVIGIVVIYLLYKVLRGWATPKVSSKTDLPAAGEDLVEDPFCHTYVPMSHALKTVFEGKTVYFCSRKCIEQYQKSKSA